jgi:hypothetical protein
LTKEIFYGWVAGVGMLLLAAGAVAWRQRRKRAVFALGILLLAATLIPLGFFSLRCIAGGVSELWMGHHQTQTAAGQSGADLSRFYTTGSGRYKAHFGLNMIRNTALATAGFFTLAPIHVLRDPDAPLALRIVPVLAIGLSILLCLGPWLVVWRSPQDWPARPCGKTVAAIVFVTFLGLSPTLPMGQITELYLLGPNVGAALLLTIGVVGWWQLLRTGPAERLSRSGEVGRAIVVVAAVTLIACGAYGVASRAYHFGVTWTYAAELNRRLLNHQRSLPSDKDRVATVFLPSACTEGAIHSQYVSPPADALNLGMTEAWLNFHDPLRRMRLVRGMPTAPLAPGDMVLDCAGLPRRQHW